jgi:hypothetical protein
MNGLNSKIVLRLMRPAPVFCTLVLFLLFGGSAHCQIPTRLLTRVLLIQVGDVSGSAFTIDVDGRQYVVTAKHVVAKVNDNDSIRFRRVDGWTSARVRVLRCDDPVDIAVLIPDKQLTLSFPLELGIIGLQFGQDAYFLGYPYGRLFTDTNYITVGNRVTIPFVKKAVWSAISDAGDGAAIFLDGHNNPGFSGGPIVYRPFDQPPYILKVAGVVSGYRPDFEYVLEPKKITPNEDLRDVEPWRIVTIGGEQFRLVDTKQMVDTNSGIVQGYSIESAVNLIKKHPEGPKVAEGQPPL